MLSLWAKNSHPSNKNHQKNTSNYGFYNLKKNIDLVNQILGRPIKASEKETYFYLMLPKPLFLLNYILAFWYKNTYNSICDNLDCLRFYLTSNTHNCNNQNTSSPYLPHFMGDTIKCLILVYLIPSFHRRPNSSIYLCFKTCI